MDADEQKIKDFISSIQTACSSTDNELRKNAEQMLFNQIAEQPHLIQYIIVFIVTFQSAEKVKEMASIFLIQLLKRLVQLQTYDAELQKFHLEILLTSLKTTQISHKIKNHLASALAALLTQDNENTLRKYASKNCFELLSSNIETAMYVFQSLVRSMEYHQNDIKWIEAFTQKGKVISAFLKEKIDTQTVQIYNLYCKNALELCKVILARRSVIYFLPKDIILMNENFSQSLLMLLYEDQMQLTISNPQLEEGKAYLLETYNIIIEYLTSDRTKEEIKASPFYAQLADLVPNFILYMISFATSEDFHLDKLQEQYHKTQILNNLIEFVAQCCTLQEFYTFYSESKPSLLFDVIYPLISTSKYELEQLESEPDQFVSISLDTVDKQNSNILKTNAAKLLEALCDHIDGATTFICEHAISIVEDDFYIGEIKNRYLFKKMNQSQRVEASLMILTVMSYLLSRRDDLIQKLEDMLQKNVNYFQNADLLVQVRLSLFLGYYCDNLFKKEEKNDNLYYYFQFLINQLKRKEIALVYQSVDALKNIFEDEEVQPKLRPILPGVFPILCQCLLECKSDQHFEMIISIVKFYHEEIQINDSSLLIMLVKILVQRIMVEKQHVLEGSKDSQIWVTKSLNVLKTIAETDAFIPRFLLIEEQLLQLYGMLELPDISEFDEDILNLVCSFIEKSYIISEMQVKLLLILPIVHEKQMFRLGLMFQLLNLYLLYGKNNFSDLKLQAILVKMCVDTMNCSHQSTNEADQAEGVLLIQLMIQQLGQVLDIENLQFLIQSVIQRSSQQIDFGFMRSRLLGVLLCCFLFDFDRTIHILNETSIVEQILNNLIENYQIYEDGYDIKLYILTMSKLLVTQSQVFSIKLIDSMVSLLVKQHTHEVRELQRQKQKLEEEDDIGFYDDDDDDGYNDDLQEAQMSLDQFKSNIKQQNEFEFFKNTIQHLKNNSPELIEQIKEKLSPFKLQCLQNILLQTRIQTRNGELDVPRKVKFILLDSFLLQIVTVKNRKSKQQ